MSPLLTNAETSGVRLLVIIVDLDLDGLVEGADPESEMEV